MSLSSQVFSQLRIKNRQIMLLDALETHRNLRRAAAAIHTTQPAASALLQQLEESLGVQLFERHSRGMEPTAYGEVMIRYSRNMLHDFERVGEEMAALQAGAAGLVRIGSVMGAVPGILSSAMQTFKMLNPKVHLSIQVDTSDLLIPNLLSGDLDIVLGRAPDEFYDADLDIRQFIGEPMAIIAGVGNDLYTHESMALQELSNATWILHPVGSPMRRRVEEALLNAGAQVPRDIVETASILLTTSLLESGNMVSVVPLNVAQHYVKYSMVRILQVTLPLSMNNLAIITNRQRKLSPSASWFLRVLMEQTRSTSDHS